MMEALSYWFFSFTAVYQNEYSKEIIQYRGDMSICFESASFLPGTAKDVVRQSIKNNDLNFQPSDEDKQGLVYINFFRELTKEGYNDYLKSSGLWKEHLQHGFTVIAFEN